MKTTSGKRNLIVFDIDGTLTDTVGLHQAAFKKALHLIGSGIFNDQFGTYKHHTDAHIAKVIYESGTERDFDDVVCGQFEDHLYEMLSGNDILEIKGSKNVVRGIEEQTDFGICYATGSLYRPAKLKLERIGVSFDDLQLVASNNIEERERIVEKAIENAREYYQVEKFDRIISFGDGLWDLKTANNLSLEFIGIGDTNKAILEANGMQKHYSDFTKMLLSEL